MESDPPPSLDEAWELAVANARRGVQVNAMEERGETFFAITRGEGLATSVLADPEFMKNAAAWLQTARFHIGWSTPDILTLWGSDSPLCPLLQDRVLSSSEPRALNLDPAVLLVDGADVRVHARARSSGSRFRRSKA